MFRFFFFVLLAVSLALCVNADTTTVFGAPGAVQATPAQSEHYLLEPAFAEKHVLVNAVKESDEMAAARKAYAALKPGDKEQFALFVDRFIGSQSKDMKVQINYRDLGITDAQISNDYLMVRDEQLLNEADRIIDNLLRMQTSHDPALVMNTGGERMQNAVNRRSYETVRKLWKQNTAPPPRVADNQIKPPVKDAPAVPGAIPLTDAEMSAVHAP